MQKCIGLFLPGYNFTSLFGSLLFANFRKGSTCNIANLQCRLNRGCSVFIYLNSELHGFKFSYNRETLNISSQNVGIIIRLATSKRC